MFNLKVCFGLAIAGSVFLSSFANAALDSAEQDIATKMAGRGVTNFLLLNKAKGQLVIIKNGTETGRIPALSGRQKGDLPKDNLPITPSGIFPLILEGDLNQHHLAISFYKERTSSYAIHPVFGTRVPKLLRSSPEDKRVTAGCINVSQSNFRQIYNVVSTAPSETLYDADEQPLAVGPFLVVTTEAPPAHKPK